MIEEIVYYIEERNSAGNWVKPALSEFRNEEMAKRILRWYSKAERKPLDSLRIMKRTSQLEIVSL